MDAAMTADRKKMEGMYKKLGCKRFCGFTERSTLCGSKMNNVSYQSWNYMLNYMLPYLKWLLLIIADSTLHNPMS